MNTPGVLKITSNVISNNKQIITKNIINKISSTSSMLSRKILKFFLTKQPEQNFPLHKSHDTAVQGTYLSLHLSHFPDVTLRTCEQ